MFSFMNFLQSVLQRLKRNKGLWFTVLSISSVIGVLISISLINIMTTNVSEQTYTQVHRVDTTQLDNVLDAKYDSLLAISGVLSLHPNIISDIKSKSDKSVNDLLALTSKTINNQVNIDPILIRYYAADYESTLAENSKYAKLVMDTTTSITGLVVNSNGVRIIAIAPVVDGNKTIGAIETSQSIATLRGTLENLGKEFAFIFDKSQLVFMDLSTKQGNTQDIDDKYKIFFHNYNPQFYTNLRDIDLEKLQREKYSITPKFYTTFQETVDIDGKPIGLFILGESSTEANSFVNITKNLISSITTVALGLVISLILFMF